MNEEEIILISKPVQEKEDALTKWFAIVLFFAIFIVLFYQAVIKESWLIFFCAGCFSMGIIFSYASSPKNTLYFTESRIIMSDEKDEYIDEIDINDNLAWNYYAKYIEDSEVFALIIKSKNRNFVIEREDYHNYYDMVDFLKNRNINRDVNIVFNSKIDFKRAYSKKEDMIFTIIFSNWGILIFIFWLILKLK